MINLAINLKIVFMKKNVFSLIVFVFSALIAQTQCVPDTSVFPPGTEFGVYPDVNENLPCGVPNEDYETVMHMIVPSEFETEFGGFPVTVTITSYEVVSVDGLPAAFVWATNEPSWAGGEVGCMTILGNTANEGTYDLTINLSADYTVFGQPGTLDTAYTGYSIVIDIGCTTVDIESLIVEQLENLVIYPNPTAGNVWNLSQDVQELTVYDQFGRVVYFDQNVIANKEIVTSFKNGVYTIVALKEDELITKKLIVD